MSHRPTVYGTRHAVSAGHYLAASAAFSVLEAGGNAIDAGCAAGIALGVLQPDLVNVAGVAPIMIRLANGHVESIAGLGWWPKTLPADIFMREHGGKIPDGVLRTVIPAAPDAWITALERHGTMRFADVAAQRSATPARASRCIRCSPPRSRRTSTSTGAGSPTPRSSCRTDACRSRATSSCSPTWRARCSTWRTRTAPPAPTARRDCARRTMRSIAATSRARSSASSSRRAAICRWTTSPSTARAIEPVVRRPWRGHEVITCGPWCQGPALLEALALLERVGIAGLAHNSATYLHRIAECVNLAMADREYHFGDPAFVDVPIDHLLDPATIARRASAVRDDRAFGEMPAPLDRTNLPHLASTAELPKVEADTSYCCVVDRWGNAFSATPSDGSGNVPVVPGLGITPSGRGSQSRPDPRHPAGVAPGKRPRLTPNPAMVVTEAGGVMPFGTPGGDVQTQAMLQVLLNIFQHGMEVQDAIEAPRVASYSFPSSFAPFEYFPGRLAVEGRIDPAVRADLAARGHEVKAWPEWTWLAGSVEAVLRDPVTGLIAAGADPRRPAYAIAI